MVKVHYSKLTLKIYTNGARVESTLDERVLRIEAIIHNTKELPNCRPLEKFPGVGAQELKAHLKQLLGMVDRFLDAVHCVDVCFIASDTLEQLPRPGLVGKTKVGGIDTNQLRMRTVMNAVVALLAQELKAHSTSPKEFTASQLAAKVSALSAATAKPYHSRQAAYDLKKLRGKQLVSRIGNSRRYRPTPTGLKAMAALIVLRDKVIMPLLAASCHSSDAPPQNSTVSLDQHYQNVRGGMQGLFGALGIAT